MKVLVIGAGNMGLTYLRSLLSSRFIEPSNLHVLTKPEADTPKLKLIPEDNYHNHPGDYITQMDVIIIAVKPQDFQTLSLQLRGHISSDQMILSVMAGITTAYLAAELGSSKIVRAMPNLPAQLGMGMTVFTASSHIDRKELFILQNLINTTGKSVYVEDETMIDAATAISGSGPAYVYFFMQSMIETAQKMGFTPSQAELLVSQTFLGAVLQHQQGELSCDQWIQRVASKGGTTEAALHVMKTKAVKPSIEEALNAALLRSQELGR